jgi:hypothetical protein
MGLRYLVGLGYVKKFSNLSKGGLIKCQCYRLTAPNTVQLLVSRS